tara:strand:- start:169 stop:456 length:288 start_codon:yes stop_codon:yes gene_type:complete
VAELPPGVSGHIVTAPGDHVIKAPDPGIGYDGPFCVRSQGAPLAALPAVRSRPSGHERHESICHGAVLAAARLRVLELDSAGKHRPAGQMPRARS